MVFKFKKMCTYSKRGNKFSKRYEHPVYIWAELQIAQFRYLYVIVGSFPSTIRQVNNHHLSK